VDKSYNFSVKVPNVKGQYQVVENILKGKTNGFFIEAGAYDGEAGAYDGEALSNSLLFELQYNWTGLLVETNPDHFEVLKIKNRKAYLTYTCLSVTNKATEVDFDAAGIFEGIINGQSLETDTQLEAGLSA
jgi:hypothetical protein